ncbi:hypothetical protein E5206_09475 [Arthrobacter sp. PAMC25564]|uniref:hypothetical protein n=1 Tax=Arthrobacter sp. PAMC25564 TaxID=2565366 RepID=UPI0010A27E73|nr:hypothetical protein [Arthrobacter sp. PAMC25564]QCB97133.1 hypothetical protein E5206_09475 [Arthrobacter sp. PAMC25564]
MKFKLGDPVRIIARTCRYFDEAGTIVDLDGSQQFPFHVAGLEDVPLWFGPDELILAEHQTRGDQ